MANITKQGAIETAKAMVSATIGVHIKAKRKELSDFLIPLYMASLPKGVSETYTSSPGFFNKAHVIKFSLALAGVMGGDILENVPSSTGWSAPLDLSAENYAKAEKLHNEISDLVKERETLERNVRAALLALKNFNRIHKEFSDAYEYIPEEYLTGPTPTGLAIPMENLIADLQKFK